MDTPFSILRLQLLRLLSDGPDDPVGPNILGLNVDQPSEADRRGFDAFERAMNWLRNEGLIRFGATVPGTVEETWFYDVVITSKGEQALTTEGAPRTDGLVVFGTDKSVEELVAAIRRDVDAGTPQAALDRLHTYCMKRFAHLLRASELEVLDADTLNGRVGRLFNPVRKAGVVNDVSAKIMKGTVEAFEAFNKVRNNASFAHDNDLLAPAEARFVFDGVMNMLRFVNALEPEHFAGRPAPSHVDLGSG